jgi:outer membrane lipoprotein-sorting protein
MNKTMPKMRPFLTIFILFITFHFAFSQDKKAKKLLDEVTAKVESYENISIDFKYALQNTKENINQESKGSVILKKNLFAQCLYVGEQTLVEKSILTTGLKR